MTIEKAQAQTKIHHGTKSYAEANSEAAAHMRNKLLTQIDNARNYGPALLRSIQDATPQDTLATMSRGVFSLDGSKLYYQMDEAKPDTKRSVHSFALTKMCEAVGVNKDYIQRLALRGVNEPWAQQLATETLNQHFLHQPTRVSRRLFRSVGDEIRGFLSDAYARLNPSTLISAFVKGCETYNLKLYGGHVTDTQFVLRATLDYVIEPVKDEVLALGVVFKESPFGDGASELSLQIERMMCTNKAIRATELRRFHIGARAPEDINDATQLYEQASTSVARQITDGFEGLFSHGAIDTVVQSVRSAHAKKITASEFDGFLKKHLTKGEMEEAKELFRSADTTNLPAGDTAWRAAQTLGFFATKLEDEHRAFEVQKLAGAFMGRGH